jgi:phosphatidylethanolamine-binding protein (PEBP) family uncharacterized protein
MLHKLYRGKTKMNTIMETNSSRSKRKKYVAFAIIVVGVICIILLIIFAFTSNQHTDTVDISSFPTFDITSSNLNDGKWDEIITNTDKGENKSPQLTWDAVDGAAKYVVIMVDPDGNNWLHWEVVTDKTYLEMGEYSGKSDGYVGPYPPTGTHQYIVYVFALAGEPYGLNEKIDSSGADIEKIAVELNGSQETGEDNILAIGKLSGTYSK